MTAAVALLRGEGLLLPLGLWALLAGSAALAWRQAARSTLARSVVGTALVSQPVVAGAVDAQGARVREIAAGVSSVFAATRSAMGALGQTAEVAEEARAAGDGVRAAADAIGGECDTLALELRSFLGRLDRRSA